MSDTVTVTFPSRHAAQAVLRVTSAATDPDSDFTCWACGADNSPSGPLVSVMSDLKDGVEALTDALAVPGAGG